jgi:hypothetical protein
MNVLRRSVFKTVAMAVKKAYVGFNHWRPSSSQSTVVCRVETTSPPSQIQAQLQAAPVGKHQENKDVLSSPPVRYLTYYNVTGDNSPKVHG